MLDGTDLASCFRTFPNWNQWLIPQRAQFLFPEVAPFLLKWLPKTALLECRRVCKTWKEGLNNAYILHPERLRIVLQKEAPRMPELVNDFSFASEIQSFLDEMEFHSGNPFLGRALSINRIGFMEAEHLDQYDDDDDYHVEIDIWDDVNQLLDRFGHHVFFLKIYLAENDFNPVEETLLDCLTRLPNLKRLEIHAEKVTSSDRIQEYYRVHPLPQLLHLQALELHAPNDLAIAVLDSCCVPYNIKQLVFSEIGEEGAYGFYEAVYNFQNLEVLDAMKFMRLEEFEQLMLIPPPFKKLRLYVYNGENSFIDFQRFFSTLELLAESLEFVEVRSLDQGTMIFNGVVNDFKINLPKLKRLNLFGYTGPLDPFLQLTSLNYLEIGFAVWRPWNDSKALLYGFENRMKKSNIWTLLPTLKKLIIKGQDWRGRFRSKYKRNNAGKITGKFTGKRKIGAQDASLSLIDYEKVYGNKSELEGVEKIVKERHDGNQVESERGNFGNVKQVEDIINESKLVCNNEDESESDEGSSCSFWFCCM